jgi:hypothetical protein
MGEPGADETTSLYHLPVSLRREALAAWRPGLLERLGRDEVSLDASDVAEVDGPSLEGLVAFVQHRRRAGQRTNWSGVSVLSHHARRRSGAPRTAAQQRAQCVVRRWR